MRMNRARRDEVRVKEVFLIFGLLLTGLVIWINVRMDALDEHLAQVSAAKDKSKVAPEEWWTDDTVDTTTVFQEKRLKVEYRKRNVRGTRMDWLWVEVPSSVNVLVRRKGKYVVFNQTKYGIHGTSLAPIGGYVENAETALDAAVREVREELGCDPVGLKFLGKYRVDVNRGFGMISLFITDDCLPLQQRFDSDDIEVQHRVHLTRDELKDALIQGKFKEVKWSAVVAMALVHHQE